MKRTFPVLCYCWVFQICWHIKCSIFTASSFRIWKSSAGVPSPWLALFVVMLLKALLTSHFRMFGSQWVTTPSWLSRSLRPFLYSFCFLFFGFFLVCSCYLFSISSASVRSFLVLSFIVPIFAWNVSWVSPIFLKRSPFFPSLLFSSISLHCSVNKAFLPLFVIIWNSAFSWVYLSLPPLPFAFFFS